jgi:hypothetical protein
MSGGGSFSARRTEVVEPDAGVAGNGSYWKECNSHREIGFFFSLNQESDLDKKKAVSWTAVNQATAWTEGV